MMLYFCKANEAMNENNIKKSVTRFLYPVS